MAHVVRRRPGRGRRRPPATWDVGVARTSAAAPAGGDAGRPWRAAGVATRADSRPTWPPSPPRCWPTRWTSTGQRLDRLEADVAAHRAGHRRRRSSSATTWPTTMAEAAATLDDVIAAVGTATDAVARARTRIVVPRRPDRDRADRRPRRRPGADRRRRPTPAGGPTAASALVALADRRGERRSCAAGRAPTPTRHCCSIGAELRGRLDAYRAKADRAAAASRTPLVDVPVRPGPRRAARRADRPGRGRRARPAVPGGAGLPPGPPERTIGDDLPARRVLRHDRRRLLRRLRDGARARPGRTAPRCSPTAASGRPPPAAVAARADCGDATGTGPPASSTSARDGRRLGAGLVDIPPCRRATPSPP